MNLSARGAIVTWFVAASFMIGLLLQNPFALVTAVAVLAFLGLQAVRFRRFLTFLADKLSVNIIPAHISTFVAVNFKLSAIITNAHKIPVRIISSRPKISRQVVSVADEGGRYFLLGGSEYQVDVSMRALSPGYVSLSKWILQLQDKMGLFTHNLAVPCTMDIEVAPVIGKIESKLQLGSLASLTRFGTGTDLDRIREVVSMEDFHSLDWKSTARTGKFMRKEYLPETEPSVLIIADTSALATNTQVLEQLGKLVVTFITSTPVGVILYDKSKVVDELSPSTGAQSRLLVLRSLLAGASAGGLNVSARNGVRLHNELVELIRLLQSTSTKPSSHRVDVYAKSLLPYYEATLAKYMADIGQQGVFRALEILSNTPPKLLVVISNYDQDLRGLCEGVILANASGHRIILGFVGSSRDALPANILALKESGIQVLQSGGADLADAIRQAIVNIPMMRIRTPRQLQLSRAS